MIARRLSFTFLLLMLASTPLHAADTGPAANAINSFGIDLLKKTGAANANALLSPYSIETALAMTYAGADGQTRDEMAKTLYFPKDDAALNDAFAELRQQLESLEKSTAEMIGNSKKRGGPSEPITLAVANRLFGQQGYDFLKPFLTLVKDKYGAPLEELDFKKGPDAARTHINDWVAERTKEKIKDLIPGGGISDGTRLVLVNAIYLKAPWAEEFKVNNTEPAPFQVNGKTATDVPMMHREAFFSYRKADGYTAVGISYIGNDLQFLVLLPDDPAGLPALEARLTAQSLAGCAKLEGRKVSLYLPKFKLQPPTMQLGKQLQSMGMKTAFDIPRKSADFDLMAKRTPGNYLYISEVFHKTFLSLDEHGTEAAAATAVAMMAGSAMMREPPTPVVRVDHPFLFAIQHKPSGACIFLGRLTDPR